MGRSTSKASKLRIAAREKLIAEQLEQERRKRIRALKSAQTRIRLYKPRPKTL